MKKEKLSKKALAQVEELRLRRVKLWKIYHELPEDDERRAKVKEVAQGIYDGLVKIGVEP